MVVLSILAEVVQVFLKVDSFSLPFKNPVLIFSTILFIILFAPILLNRVRIPHLIGLIIAGAIIGPNAVGLVERDGAFVLFGQVGLLYIMFLAGLEIDWAEFRKNSGKSLVFGMYTFWVPMVLGWVSGYFVLGFSMLSSILLASLFASHTLIAYPLISKLGISKNRAVNVTLGGTLITDTLALLVLAVIVGLSTGEYNDTFWWRLGISILVFGTSVMVGFPILARWFFKRYSDNIAQYIFVLALVFLASFLSELAGIEAIIGAFLAGLALNRLIPHTSGLMNRIEFVGNALFIPFFLIGVGMLVDYKVFFKSLNTLWVATVMTVVATLAKYIAAWLAQKSFGYTPDERRIIFGLSNAQAAATLAAVLIGYNVILGYDANGNPERLLNDSVLNGAILMILVTCTVASFAAQKGGRNVALQEAETAPEKDTSSDEKLLIAINDAEMAAQLVELAVTVKNPGNKSGIFALNVIDNMKGEAADEKKAERVLNIAAEQAAATDNRVQQLKRYDLNIVNAITSVVKEHAITDIMMGLHKQKGMSDNFLGNLGNGILAGCNATTLIYKPVQPLATVKRYIVVVPERAEMEMGFPFWLIKVWNMSRNTGAKLVFYGTENTLQYIQSIAKANPVEAEYKAFTDWDDFLILGRDLQTNDNLVVVMSRKQHPSYLTAMARIPYYLNRYFADTGYVLIYPMQTGIEGGPGGDLNNPAALETLQENIGVIDDIAKNISRLFKRK